MSAAPGSLAADAIQPLSADRDQIARFVNALFSGLDDRGFVSLRAFRQSPPKGERDTPLHIEAIGLNLGLEPIIDAAVRIATRIANGGEAGVFAPPICTFTSRKGAKAGDVHEAPVLSVEADRGDLERIADGLSLILGERPTIVLHSGSIWTDPKTGELLPKGHLHWLLSRPARGPEALRMLRRARDIAVLIAGGDPTGAPPVHPLRFPGTWNKKTEPPAMARIVEETASAIDLAEALAALEDAAEAASIAVPKGAAHLAPEADGDDLPTELTQIAEWLTFYTTAHLRPAKAGLRHDWNNVAMAIHRATAGSEDGFKLFNAWSATAPLFYSKAGCRRRWAAITGCPPTWIGARFLRNKAIARGWVPTPPADWEAAHPVAYNTGPEGTPRRANGSKRRNGPAPGQGAARTPGTAGPGTGQGNGANSPGGGRVPPPERPDEGTDDSAKPEDEPERETGPEGEEVPPPEDDAGDGPGEADIATEIDIIPPDDVLDAIVELGPNVTRKLITALFNKRYVMAVDGNKPLVMWTSFDPVLKRDRIERASFEDFKKFFSNRKLTIPGKPRPITKNFGEWWLDDPNRRQYLGGVVFNPGGVTPPHMLNLWRGWAVTAAPGDWSLMHAHIHHVICGGREEITRYVIRWLAHMVQHPDLPGEVAIVMRGLKGVGKGVFGKWILRLCGQHGLHVINATHLTGRFMGHLRDVLFVFADEALFAGDKQHEGILKGIITEQTLLIEPKHLTPVMAANLLHILMSSNNDWVVPATHDERRYLMLDVLATYIGNFAYFAALNEQMENGGLAAMLHDLQTMDLGDFHPRRVPDTHELGEQKMHSLDSAHRWWMAVLSRGFVWKSRYGHKDFLAWDEFVTTELLTRSYTQWCTENRINYPASRVAIGMMMSGIYQQSRLRAPHPVYEIDSVDRDERQAVVKMPNQHGYQVGTLDNARDRFTKKLKLHADAAEWNTPEC